MFPHDVEGWLTEDEGNALRVLATGKLCLEIGSFCGRSTICIAQSAKHVHAVDPFDGRATDKPGYTLDEFKANLQRHGVSDRVTIWVGESGDPAIEVPVGIEFAFVDGAHDQGSVMRDIEVLARVMKPGGLVAFHDYRSGIDPGVTAAVDHLLTRGAKLITVVDSMAVVEFRNLPAQNGPVVLLARPSYDGRSSMVADQATYLQNSRTASVMVTPMRHSSLPLNFSGLWCTALNARQTHGVTHFAMLHDDIEPQAYWLDILLEELQRTGADVVSAVAPIKDDNGVSSTAIDEPGHPYAPLYRLTMHQIARLPQTFSAADCGHPDKALLVNTGCWVCKFHDGWEDKFALDEAFNQHCKIECTHEGFYRAKLNPEDWQFSRWCHANGIQCLATRKVKLHHVGSYRFPNDIAWGWETDKGSELEQHRRAKERESKSVRPELVGVNGES